MIVLNYPLILSTVVVPYVAAFVSWVSGNRLSPKAHAALNSASLAYGFAVFLALSCTYGLGEVIRDPEIYFIPTLGRFSFLMDASTFPALLSISLVTAVVSLYSVPYMEHRFEELEKDGIKAPSWGSYFLLYTLFSASMIGCLLGTNTIEFYIFLELTLIPSFLLIAFYGYGDRVRIAIMYLIWTHVGAVLFLLGALSVGFASGFDFINPSTGEMLLGLGDGLPASTLYVAMWLMVVGLLVKVAVFGVHMWLPYAHAEAPTPVSALLSPCLIGIGALMLLRIVYVLFPSAIQTASPLLFVWALITMIYGGFMALVQKDFKRLLAYSSISQMGYLLLGLASMNAFGMSGMILHYMVHAFGKAILFMAAGTLIVMLHGLRDITKMGGLSSKLPYTGGLALIGFMHITGIPPTLGLWSEYLIVRGAIEYSMKLSPSYFIPSFIGLVVAIGLSTAYAFLTMKRVFYGRLPEGLKDAVKAKRSLLLPMGLLAVAGILSFILVGPMLDPLMEVLKALYGL